MALLAAATQLAATVVMAGPLTAAPPAPIPVVRLPFPQDDGSLTPYSFGLGHSLMTLVYDTLLWRDENGVAQPWLARSVEPNPDGTELIVRLVTTAFWHDGRPLTSADVVFTFSFVASHPHPRFTPQLAAVKEVAAVDAQTVVIKLRHPSLGFRDQPLADLPIMPRHLWAGVPPNGPPPPGLPVGSGPYRLVEHRPGARYTFEANAEYFRGPPAVQLIEVPIITSADETLDALRSRKVDMLPMNLHAGSASLFRRFGTKVVRGPSYAGTVLLFNLRVPPFDRPEVRRAVSEALDLHRIARSAGGAEPADAGYLHPQSAWAPSVLLHRTDEQSSREVLTSLDLGPLEILAPENDRVRGEAGRQVALALQRVGVPAMVRLLKRDELATAVGEDGSPPSFQLAIWREPTLSSYDPDFLRRVFGSQRDQAPLNFSGYASPAFDELAGRIATAADPESRRAVVAETLRLLATDAPVVPLFFATGSFAYRPSIYDGWVYVKGSGILDKRSFVEPRRLTNPDPAPEVTEPPERWIPVASLAMAGGGLAALAGLTLWLRGRRRSA